MADHEPLSTADFARWWRETGEHELRQLLYWKWDPIGVNAAFPRTADEYDGYAPQVEDDGFARPHRDGSNWPHFAMVDVLAG